MATVTRASPKTASSAFIAIVVVLGTVVLAIIIIAVILLVRHHRRKGQRALPFRSQTRARIPSNPPSLYDLHNVSDLSAVPPILTRPIEIHLRTPKPPSSSHRSPRILVQHLHSIYRSQGPSPPIQSLPHSSSGTKASPNISSTNRVPSAVVRYTWSSDHSSMPITSDITELSADDASALRTRGVVNQGFAERLALQERKGREYITTISSEGSSTDAGGGGAASSSGDTAAERSGSLAGMLGQIAKVGENSVVAVENSDKGIVIRKQYAEMADEGRLPRRTKKSFWRHRDGRGRDDEEPETPSWIKPPPILIVKNSSPSLPRGT